MYALQGRRVLTALIAGGVLIASSGSAVASTVTSSVVDVTAPTGAVSLSPGASGEIIINLSVTGNQGGTSTFEVYRDWVLSNGVFTGSNPIEFSVAARKNTDAATTFSTTGKVTVAAGEAGDITKTLTVHVFDITNGQSGAKLEAGTHSTYSVTVLKPTDPCLTVSAPAAPDITPDASKPNGGGGYFKTIPDVAASTTTSGATLLYATEVGGVKSAYGSSAPTLGQGMTVVYAKATSATCNKTSESSATFNVDSIAPVISGENVVDGAWRNTDLAYDFTATDATSGLLDADKQFTVTASNASTSATAPTVATRTVTDIAGNSASRSVSARIDKTAPEISGDDINATTWSSTAVSRDFTATDALSGLKVATDAAFKLTAEIESADAVTPTTVSKKVVDAAGNEAVRQLSAKIDLSAPVISGDDVNDTGWRNTPLSESFTASDRLSGLATAGDASFRLTVEEESVDATTPTSISRTVTDKIGRSSKRTVSALIDTTAPSIVDKGATSEPNAADWYKTAVTNRFERTDALSGLTDGQDKIEEISTADQQGLAVKVSSSSVSDKAGNSAAAKDSVTFNIDLTKPSNAVTGVANNATYTVGSVPAAGCDTTDGLSGVAAKATLAATQPGGVGTKTVTCSGGADVAGNSADSVSVTYKVVYATSAILQPLNADHSSKVKLGSTIPVKIRFEGASAGISSAVINIGNQKITSSVTGEVLESFDVVTPHTGTQMRYDATGDLYIFNLSTKNLTVGTWKLTLTLDDGTTRTVNYSIVK